MIPRYIRRDPEKQHPDHYQRHRCPSHLAPPYAAASKYKSPFEKVFGSYRTHCTLTSAGISKTIAPCVFAPGVSELEESSCPTLATNVRSYSLPAVVWSFQSPGEISLLPVFSTTTSIATNRLPAFGCEN